MPLKRQMITSYFYIGFIPAVLEEIFRQKMNKTAEGRQANLQTFQRKSTVLVAIKEN